MLAISGHKFKIYKSDAAPFFFFVDVFPPDTSYINKEHFIALIKDVELNPIMPLPMRVDRVYNGERSVLIRPRKPITSNITEDLTAIINPRTFTQLGIQKLLYFTEIYGRDKFSQPISSERVTKWWNSSRFLYGHLSTLEEDFSNFLKTYLETLIKAKINKGDLVKAAIEYCQLISDVCKKRMDENSILIEIRERKLNVKLYKEKDVQIRTKFKKINETQIHPELIDLEVFNLLEEGFNPDNNKDVPSTVNKPKVKKYIPLLFYDDLYECMLDNLSKLEQEDPQILDPAFLIDNKIIILEESKNLVKEDLMTYSWWDNYDDIDLELIIESIKTTLKNYFLKIYPQLQDKEDRWKQKLDF